MDRFVRYPLGHVFLFEGIGEFGIQFIHLAQGRIPQDGGPFLGLFPRGE